MGKLDKFRGPQAPATRPDRPTPVRRVSRDGRSAAERIAGAGASGRVAIALDATGSMGGLITMAKDALGEIISRVFQEAGRPITLQLLVYRDYDMGNLVVEAGPAASDPTPLQGWLASVVVDGGGANDGEAIEAGLERLMEEDRFDAILIAGDEPSNSRASLTNAGRADAPSAHDLARRLRQGGSELHAFVVGADPRTIGDFEALAAEGGGQCGRLDGSEAMIDMAVMAMLSALKGRAAVRRYVEGRRLSAGAEEFATRLLAPPKT